MYLLKIVSYCILYHKDTYISILFVNLSKKVSATKERLKGEKNYEKNNKIH